MTRSITSEKLTDTLARVPARMVARLRTALAMLSPVELRDGDRPINILKLISPLRYDILVRRKLFEFIGSELRTYYHNPKLFLLQASELPYYVWFEKVSCARFRPDLVSDTSKRREAFAQKIDRCVSLYVSYLQKGFLAEHPITLRTGLVINAADSGKLVCQRLFTGDGCHRLALLLHSGVLYLPAQWYKVKVSRHYTPLDNTLILLRSLDIAPDEYAAFLAHSFDLEASSIAELVRLVRQRLPNRIAELHGILAFDSPHVQDAPLTKPLKI